jgi:tetratricopeptide (TPR) repeat protein
MRQLHPDRLASLGLRELVPRAERVVARLGEAHAVLTDPALRAEYVARRAGGPPVGDGRAILAAEQHFREGERLLTRGDAAAAAERFADAARGDPGEPTYKAALAWARWEAAGEGRLARTAETVAAIEAALAARPRFAQGHHWLGLVAKRAGDLRGAARAFRQAVEAGGEAGFLDAERELRLIDMRRAQGPVDKGRGGADAGRPDPKAPGRFFRR